MNPKIVTHSSKASIGPYTWGTHVVVGLDFGPLLRHRVWLKRPFDSNKTNDIVFT